VTLTDKPAVSIPELQVWMKRVDPIVCTFRANPLAENPMHNEMAYKSLVAMLLTKNLVCSLIRLALQLIDDYTVFCGVLDAAQWETLQ
jgi:hypothetical protein